MQWAYFYIDIRMCILAVCVHAGTHTVEGTQRGGGWDLLSGV